MNTTQGVSAEHPLNSFYFLLGSKPTQEFSRAFELMLVSIGKSRCWVIDAPALVDYIDEVPKGSGKIDLNHTYGGTLQIYSAMPPWGVKLPKEIDRAHYEEVKQIVDELSALSTEFNVAFSLQLDETHIGHIREGAPDRSVQIGLWMSGEWQLVIDLACPP